MSSWCFKLSLQLFPSNPNVGVWGHVVSCQWGLGMSPSRFCINHILRTYDGLEWELTKILVKMKTTYSKGFKQSIYCLSWWIEKNGGLKKKNCRKTQTCNIWIYNMVFSQPAMGNILSAELASATKTKICPGVFSWKYFFRKLFFFFLWKKCLLPCNYFTFYSNRIFMWRKRATIQEHKHRPTITKRLTTAWIVWGRQLSLCKTHNIRTHYYCVIQRWLPGDQTNGDMKQWSMLTVSCNDE